MTAWEAPGRGETGDLGFLHAAAASDLLVQPLEVLMALPGWPARLLATAVRPGH